MLLTSVRFRTVGLQRYSMKCTDIFLTLVFGSIAPYTPFTTIFLPRTFLVPDVSLDIGIPLAPETTDAVFASFTSYWNIALKLRLLFGVAVPLGWTQNRFALLCQTPYISSPISFTTVLNAVAEELFICVNLLPTYM